jgi:hypothetical protein
MERLLQAAAAPRQPGAFGYALNTTSTHWPRRPFRGPFHLCPNPERTAAASEQRCVRGREMRKQFELSDHRGLQDITLIL